ncbi:MAG: SAM-dependent methyltransferase, partial [Rickettsiaceae bacterium]|nr:SAM-dependent methyltransferase [Rickettsiaceae bacterium]
MEIAKKISEHISQNSGAAIIVDYGYDSVCCCHSCECRNPGVTKCHEVAHYHLDPGSRLAGLLALDDIVCRCCHSCEGRNPGITKSHEVAHYNSTLQAIKNHKFHNVLDSIGKADLSCHVDFWALK